MPLTKPFTESFSGPKIILLIIAIAILLPQTSIKAYAKDRLAGPIPAEVVRVIDGDTVRVNAKIWLDQEIEISVRVAGIDAPELYRPKCEREKQQARLAKTFVQNFFRDKNTFLYNIENGKYAGRVVATLINSDGEDLAKSLVQKNYAAATKRGFWCS